MTARDVETAVYRLIQEARSTVNLVALREQLFRLRVALVTTFLVSMGGIMGTVTLARLNEAELSWLTRDPGAVAKTGYYVGILSTAGVMIWVAATAICFFGAFLLHGISAYRQTGLFLLASAAVCLLLALDDAFLLHEEVFPTYLQVPEKGVYLVYFSFIGGYFLYFFGRILTTDYLVLALALLFLGLSLAVEGLFPMSNYQTFVEDSLKFTGIVFWTAYYVRTTFMAIREAIT